VRLSELSELQRTLREQGTDCRVLRSLRVRNPLSHYLSFFTWGVSKRANLDANDSREFIKWANATPNLQASILLSPRAGSVAPQRNRLHSAGRLRHFVPGLSDAGRSRLVALLQHVDLLAPLEEFDAALLLTAAALGLRHVQHHTVSTDCIGTLSERVDLDDSKERHKLETNLALCSERQLRKRCPPQMQAECEAVVRRVAPLDYWLHEYARQRFRLNVTSAGAALTTRLRSYARATRGVWRGGRPGRARCKFVRLTAAQAQGWRALDFEHHLCTPGPQAVMEKLTADTKYDRHALIVPNTAGCLAHPLSDDCSHPLRPLTTTTRYSCSK